MRDDVLMCLGSSASFSYSRWLVPGNVFGIAVCSYFYLFFICQVEVLERFQEQAGDSRQLNTAMCLSMKTAFLGFFPTMVGCQEKMLLALWMIWPYSGLVLVLYVIEKNEYFWLFIWQILLLVYKLCCFYIPYMNLWFYMYTNVWRKMLKTSG